jgi:hypothetical protein
MYVVLGGPAQRLDSVSHMAGMTDYEATAVNVVISYLAGRNESLPDEVITSLAILAKRANGRLQSGWSGDAVRAHWADPKVGPAPQ